MHQQDFISGYFLPFVLQVYVLLDGSNSSCSYLVDSYIKMAKEQGGQCMWRVWLKHWPQPLWGCEDQCFLQQ